MLTWFAELAALAGEAIYEASAPVLLALFGVAALTEVGFPFPFLMDGVLFYTGYITDHVVVRTALIILALFTGRVVGASAIYWLARLTGNSFLAWLGRRWPKILTNLEELKKKLGMGSAGAVAVARVATRVVAFDVVRMAVRVPGAVAVARLTPGLLTGVSVASGAIAMPYWQFVVGILFASLVADGALILSGVVAGLGVQFLGVTPSPWVFAIGLMIVVALMVLVPRFVLRRRGRRG